MKQAAQVQSRYLALVREEESCSKGIPTLEKLVQISGVEPSKEVIRETFLRYIEHVDTETERETLAQFFQQHQVSRLVSTEELQAICDRLFNEKEYFDVRDIMEVTGMKPTFREEWVQQAYADALKEDVFRGRIACIREISGIKPLIQEKAVQAKYRQIARDKERDYLLYWKDLHEVTGIVPNLSNQFTQNLLAKHLREEDYPRARELHNLSSVPYPPSVVSELYVSMLEKGHYGSMKRLEFLTNVVPTEQVLWKHFVSLVGQGNYRQANRFKKDFGVQRRLTTEQTHQMYQHFPKNFYIGDVKDIIELGSDAPSKERIEQWYFYLFERGDIKEFDKLEKITGIVPSKAVLKKIKEAL